MHMKHQNKLNDYSQKLNYYIGDITGTGYLAFRDIPQIIQKYSQGGRQTLDFGCGAGRSTRFLKRIGLNVTGVDINHEMINTAKEVDNKGNYLLINDYQEILNLPHYDIIFNSFVLFEFGDRNILNKYISALHSILNPGGILISVINSDHLFTKDWLSCVNNFEENKNLKSGDIAKIKLPLQGDIELYDYYWTESDYINFFKQAGFSSINIHQSIGYKEDPYLWKDEYSFNPYNIYICTKT